MLYSGRRVVLVLATAGLVAAACGADAGDGQSTAPGESPGAFDQSFEGAEAYPVIVSSEVVVGKNRFLVGILDSNDAPIGSPSLHVAAKFFDLEESTEQPVFAEDFDFIESVPGERGIYKTEASFDSPGKWGAEVHMEGDGVTEVVRTSFDVGATAGTPAIGEPAPASDTPTSADVKDLSEISTDPRPNPRFYRESIAGALKAGRPFVVVFATPKFCRSQVCGPTLEIVKDVAKSYPRVSFIHVEPYNFDDPANLETVPSAEEWGLPSEPWVFVVDDTGRLAAKYEGVVSPGELKAELSSL